MARAMPPLDALLTSRVADAVNLARAGETVRTAAGVHSPAWREFHVARLATLYEVAFLKLFIEWEGLLEATFYRYACGYRARNSSYRSGTVLAPTIPSAESLVLAGRSYLLWHDPLAVIRRSQRFFSLAPHETVIGAATTQLTHIANIRHRIAHGQSDARAKFDNSTMQLVGRRYRGSHPGTFLRDFDFSVAPPVRWLETLGNQLSALGTQLV